MNNKISSGYVMTIAVGLVTALFPGLANFLILQQSKNASIVAIIVATILGLMPVFMIIKISKNIKNQTLKDYTKQKLGKTGAIINIVLILIAIFILFLNSWLIIDFIISQFLTRTSYYLIAILFFTIIAVTINKGIEGTSRTIFILFILTVTLMTVLWTSLTPYIELDNLKPYIDTNTKNIIGSALIYISATTLPMLYILDLKHITNDKKNFERKIIIAYLISSFIVTAFIFFIISVYGIEIANLLTYPVYSLFKKVQILGFIERIENFAAIQIIVAFYIQASYLIYFLRENISSTFKIINKKKKNILTYLTAIIIPITSIKIFKNYNITNIVQASPYVLGILIIVIALLFIVSLKKEKIT